MVGGVGGVQFAGSHAAVAEHRVDPLWGGILRHLRSAQQHGNGLACSPVEDLRDCKSLDVRGVARVRLAGQFIVVSRSGVIVVEHRQPPGQFVSGRVAVRLVEVSVQVVPRLAGLVHTCQDFRRGQHGLEVPLVELVGAEVPGQGLG